MGFFAGADMKGLSLMSIISNIFRKLNTHFLHDEDEAAPISDYLWFYGFNGGCIVLSIFMLFKILTF